MSAPLCPCGSGLSYADCCRPALRGEAPATTAEALMRSRYTAFVRCDAAYLLRTWHPDTRPDTIEFGETQWRGLDVLTCLLGGPDDQTGTVEFAAHFVEPGDSASTQTLHEVSTFARQAGEWVYVEGEFPSR